MEEFSSIFGDACDFQHESLQTLPAIQNLHSWGKLVVSLSGTYSHEILAHLFILGARHLAGFLMTVGRVLLNVVVSCCQCCIVCNCASML